MSDSCEKSENEYEMLGVPVPEDLAEEIMAVSPAVFNRLMYGEVTAENSEEEQLEAFRKLRDMEIPEETCEAMRGEDTEVGFPVDDLIEQVTLLCQQAYRDGVPAGRIQYLMECEAETWEAVANDEIAIDEVEGSGR